MFANGRPTLVVYRSAVRAGGTFDFVTFDCISIRPANTLHLSVIFPVTPKSMPRTR